jgi:hypothetical protein
MSAFSPSLRAQRSNPWRGDAREPNLGELLADSTNARPDDGETRST